MELLMLMVGVVTTWAIANLVDSLTYLGQLLRPSSWLVGGIALVLTTWIMRD